MSFKYVSENTDADGKLITIINEEEPLFIDDAGSGIIYYGYAKLGSSPDAPVWKIKKIEKTGNITSVSYADMNRFYDNVWSDRATLEYTDKIKPVIQLTGSNNITNELGTPFQDPGFKAIDNIDGDITDKVSVGGDLDIYTVGTYEITYNVSDYAGNSATEVKRTVNVVDTTPPTVPTGFVTTGYSHNEVNVTWGESTDNGVVSGYKLYNNSKEIDFTTTTSFTYVDLEPSTQYVLAVSAVDNEGNESHVTQLTVTTTEAPDTTEPVLNLLGSKNMTINLNTPFEEPGYKAVDDRDGDVTSNVIVSGVVDHTSAGVYTVTYKVSDSAGNEASKDRVVTVVDTTPPSLPSNLLITGITDTTISLEWDPSTDGDGVRGYKIYKGADFIEEVLGDSYTLEGLEPETEYTIGIVAVDNSGNESGMISVTGITYPTPDTTKPVIILSGSNNINIEYGSAYTEPGYAATDDVDGDITADVIVTGTIDSMTLGSYVLRYNVQDSSGNNADEVTRTVNVTDTIAPTMPSGINEITKTYESVTIGWNPSTDSVGVTGYNVYKNSVFVEEVASSPYTFNGLEYETEHLFEVSAIDGSGNESDKASITVTTDPLPDTTKPTITLIGDNPLELVIGSEYEEPGYSATDDVDGDITADVIVTGIVDHDSVGEYEIKYNVSDSSGNHADEVIRVVNVIEE